MITRRIIRAYATEVARQFRPEKIILFGSYAHGHPARHSDVDLLIIMRHPGRSVYQAAKIQNKVRPPFPTDMIVRSNRTIRERVSLGDSFLKEALHQGIVLYESADA